MAKNEPMSAAAWHGRVTTCRQVKKEYIKTWQDSVSYRRGKPFRTAPTEDTINVPVDWTKTKNKQAKLFYQVPELKLKARRPEFAGATAVFAAALNFELTERVKAQHMMNEVLSDVVNAAGIGVCKVGYEATFEEVEVPELPPDQVEGLPPDQIKMMTQPKPLYECYYARRISPAHFLWPVEFTGSDWNQAPWIGWEGYLPLAEAVRRGWVEEDFEGTGMTDPDWFLVKDHQTQQKTADKYVKFCEIFTRAANFDPKEKDHNKIKRIVLVDGKKADDSMVVNEDFAWQRYVPAVPPNPGNPAMGVPPQPGRKAHWIGMTSYPIKVVTITNISDLAIPPSDSEIGRPQVRELIKGRSQMMRQREQAIPLRWFDINMIDEEIADKLRKGKWLDMIPMNGPGDKAIGEVARASWPKESFQFDVVAKKDLDDSWSMGGPQEGNEAEGETTATEIKTMSAALNERLDYERSWILRFFLEVAEGIGQLMQLFQDDEEYAEVVGPDGVAQMQAWNKDSIQGQFIFQAKPDSQLRLDVSQKRVENLNLYKLLRRDPFVNPQGLVQELLELHGYDPAKAMAKPQESKPQPPKINYSFKGDDLMNPYVIAIIQKSGQVITPEDIVAASKLIQTATQMVMQPPVTAQPQPQQQPQQPNGSNPVHPGPAPVVEPINQRYNQGMEAPAAGGGEGRE